MWSFLVILPLRLGTCWGLNGTSKVKFFSHLIKSTTEIVSFKIVLTVCFFWEALVFITEATSADLATFYRFLSFGLGLPALLLVTGGVDQFRIDDHSDPQL